MTSPYNKAPYAADPRVDPPTTTNNDSVLADQAIATCIAACVAAGATSAGATAAITALVSSYPFSRVAS